jgi:hypothetical protein
VPRPVPLVLAPTMLAPIRVTLGAFDETPLLVGWAVDISAGPPARWEATLILTPHPIDGVQGRGPWTLDHPELSRLDAGNVLL